jgi:signal transduction histidine kinase
MRGNNVTLRVLDNGSGISVAALDNGESLGLLGMKERAAMLGGEVLFGRGRKGGTLVTIRIPNCEP